MKSIIRLVSIAFVITIACFLALYMRPTQNRDTILVAGMFVWPPFMSITPNGSYEGFDIDVAQAVAAKLGKKLEIIDMGSLASLFIALEQRKIDMIFSGLDITQKRQQELIMIPYTGTQVTTLSLLFWKEIPAKITNINDLAQTKNAILCYEPGSANETFLKDYPQLSQKPLSSVVDMLMDIKYGKSTAAILEPTIAQRLAQQNPEIKLLSIPLGTEFQLYGMGIAIKKSNTALALQISTAINQLKEQGTISSLENKWGLGETQ
jgi:ABC-type amino acid transport substrate-binding protein